MLRNLIKSSFDFFNSTLTATARWTLVICLMFCVCDVIGFEKLCVFCVGV